MTAQEIIDRLMKLSEEDRKLEVMGICGSSGVSYEIRPSAEVSVYEPSDYDAGPICEYEEGKRYIRASLS